MSIHLRTNVLLSVIVSLLGCSGHSPTYYPVTGEVTVDGKPMVAGTVALRSDGAPGVQSPYIATGKVTNGKYEIFTGQRIGASLGFYKVLVTSTNYSGNPEPPTGGTIPMPKSLIDPKYGQLGQTPLSFEVVADPEAGAYDLEVSE
ncbi:hypothetical protein [Bythopirellula goksoeyrii]|uniref:Carboxypeptidase regulatory-like domain-containing protein n=1 Tax=Bythopirellula goksoeyrii TaxID=1400387 RepID=A0A5B9Q7K7_9BACT|nr:hypothetical protein [Bythopirellula goksoeyrii]QEG33412.1 hypothetical protein Pr1d_06750 [Bythopirellula goksoeyrii]